MAYACPLRRLSVHSAASSASDDVEAPASSASMGGLEETAYMDQHLTIRDGRYHTKHIFAGETRMASKMDPDWFQYPPTLYYHPDHLGSTNFVSRSAIQRQA